MVTCVPCGPSQAAGARLEVLGVQGAETWLRPELQAWGRALRGRAPAWRVQQDRAARWLSLWTTKYKVCTLTRSAPCGPRPVIAPTRRTNKIISKLKGWYYVCVCVCVISRYNPLGNPPFPVF